MEKIKNIIWKNKDKNWILYADWMFIIVFATGVYIFAASTCIPREFSDDDWGIANYFAGVMGAEYATPYNKFINFILGWVMYGIYQFLPGSNWFFIVQELIVILSFALFQYMLIQKMKEYLSCGWCYFITSVFLVSFEPSYLCRLSFTQTAAIGSIVGICWMIFSYKNKSNRGFIFGIILAFISALHRFGSFEMCLPFIGLYLLNFELDKCKKFSLKEMAGNILKDRKLYLSIMGVVCVCWVLGKWNTAIYNSEYYAEYNAFNAARASVLDYPKAPYEDIAEELEAIGVSENDYALIISWTIADLSFITTDLLKDIAAIEPKANIEIDYKSEIEGYFDNLKDPERIYNKLFYMALIILILCMFLDFRNMVWYLPVLLTGTIIIEIYFTVVVKRYPSYVRTGLIFALIMTALLMTDFSKFQILRGKRVVTIIASAAIVLGLFPLGNDYYLSAKGTFEYNMDGLAMYQYMNRRENDIFMIPTGDPGGLPALRNSYSIFKETQPGIMRHTVGLGGWSTNNPWVNEAYHSWGIDYPMSQTADENVYVLTSFAMAQRLQTYLKEHHDMDTSASLTAVEYGTTIYKITDCDLFIEEEKGCGIINRVGYSFDETYNTYDITINVSNCEPTERGDSNRVFVSLTDEEDNTQYFMVFGGNDLNIDEKSNELVVKIPTFFIENDMEYTVNVLTQVDGINRYACKNGLKFSL
jgi:hypothetical protein